MTIQATAWAARLRNISPLAKLAALGIGDGYQGEGKESVRLGWLVEFCCVEEADVRAALEELRDWHDVSFTFDGDRVSNLTLPVVINERFSRPREPDKSLCHIYVIRSEKRTKIGIARNPAIRIESLQAWAPEHMAIIWTASGPRDVIRWIEAACHRELAAHRIAGEWFDILPPRAIEVVKAQMAKHGLA